jgi:hypothetical protein
VWSEHGEYVIELILSIHLFVKLAFIRDIYKFGEIYEAFSKVKLAMCHGKSIENVIVQLLTINQLPL